MMGMMRGLVGLVARVPTRVETKLLAAFLTIAMLLVLVGIVGLGVLTGVNARTEELIKLQHKIEAYHQVQHDITSQLYGVTAALLSSDDKTLSSALRQLDQFGYDVDRLQFVAKDEAEMLARLRQNYDQFVELITRSVELIRAGHASEAREMQAVQAAPLADRLERLTNQLVNKAEADMVAGIETSKREYENSRWIVATIALGSVMLALALGYTISWSLIGPVKEIESGLNQVAAGNFTHRVEVINRDELGVLAANVNKMTEELKQREEELSIKTNALEQLSSQLAKYLSPQVYESIFTGRSKVAVASRRKKLTIFFSDLEGFTETSERLESEDLTQFLNHYLTEMSKIALQFGGTIDKYVGDAILIFFGDPDTQGVKADAVACVKMAIAMSKRMRQLDSVWRASGIEKPPRFRTGINTGFCTVGNFGSEDRMDYTIIGSGVNLARRLEQMAPPGEILISYETYAHVKDQICCEARGEINVKGFSHAVATYQVIDLYDKLAKSRNLIHEESARLKLDIDMEEMSTKERSDAVTVLQHALDRLSRAKESADPVSPIEEDRA
jgi:class 3 adenylate cyclase/HAMP domain-containing protein